MFKSALLYVACLGGTTGVMRVKIFSRWLRVSSWGLGPPLCPFTSCDRTVSCVPSGGLRGVANACSVLVLTATSTPFAICRSSARSSTTPALEW